MLPSWLGRNLVSANRIPLLNRLIRIEKRPRQLDQDYWRQSLDAKVPYEMWVRLTWPASKELFTFAYRRSLGEIYLQRDTSAYFAVIEAMQQERCIPPIGDSSRIFEPGCNVGAILREFQRRYDCLVVGL